MQWMYNCIAYVVFVEHAAAVAYEKSKPLVIENVEVAPPQAIFCSFLFLLVLMVMII